MFKINTTKLYDDVMSVMIVMLMKLMAVWYVFNDHEW